MTKTSGVHKTNWLESGICFLVRNMVRRKIALNLESIKKSCRFRWFAWYHELPDTAVLPAN